MIESYRGYYTILIWEPKFLDYYQSVKGEGNYPGMIDAKELRFGKETGLETQVLQTVNDEC